LVAGLTALVLNLLLPEDMLQKGEEEEEGVEIVQDMEIQMLDREQKL